MGLDEIYHICGGPICQNAAPQKVPLGARAPIAPPSLRYCRQSFENERSGLISADAF